MDINYELYKVFYYVATSLSFSEASKQLYISQSAVSQSIKTLEKKLEQPLFIRSTKKVQLTPAGKVLLKHIEPAMNLIQRGESQLLDSGSLGLGQLHIGASDTICRYFLIDYLQKFHQTYPDVRIKVTQEVSKCANQSNQCNFCKLCGSLRAGKSGSDRDELPKCTFESFLYSENSLQFYRCFHCEPCLLQSETAGDSV